MYVVSDQRFQLEAGPLFALSSSLSLSAPAISFCQSLSSFCAAVSSSRDRVAFVCYLDGLQTNTERPDGMLFANV